MKTVTPNNHISYFFTGLKCKGKGDRKNKTFSERTKAMYIWLGVGLVSLVVIGVACIMCIKTGLNKRERSAAQPVNRRNGNSSQLTESSGTTGRQLGYHNNNNQPKYKPNIYSVTYEKRHSSTSGTDISHASIRNTHLKHHGNNVYGLNDI